MSSTWSKAIADFKKQAEKEAASKENAEKTQQEKPKENSMPKTWGEAVDGLKKQVGMETSEEKAKAAFEARLKEEKRAKKYGEIIYSVQGNRGRSLTVYDDHIRITVNTTFGSVITGNVLDGEKIIFYDDCIGIQFKKGGSFIGYLQLETASATMNNGKSNFFNENTFTFDFPDNDLLEEIHEYVFNKVKACKEKKLGAKGSLTDELAKLKILRDKEVISAEEFEQAKQTILNGK